MFGKKHSEETKQKMKKAWTKRKNIISNELFNIDKETKKVVKCLNLAA